ncbi:SDR family oxidoreductase [Dyella thiooxydans]|uniref:SDR family oxidoreductase n=1 Tax=Dyella thiooxydans TaxID=445710 RepID=UPI001969F869|nr:SDR family oxidoreductase [Dyella thiooxydans]
MKQVIVITGASSGFGWMSAIALARAGHAVYAGMRETDGRNAPAVQRLQQLASGERLDLHAIEMDIARQASVDAAIEAILAIQGRLDVVVHNAGHMAYGPAEAFTPEQFAALYDTNVLGTQRVNRAVLPHLRSRGRGLLLWVSSSSTRGGTPPYLAPYFAAKAGMDALAVSYAGELARWGIESSIVVPGAFTQGTNHFAHAGQPSDVAVATAYAEGPTADLADVALRGLAALEPADADPQAVAAAIVAVVDAPHGRRPFRVHVDPAQDGAEVVNGVADRVRAELLRRIGLGDLLHPRVEA